MIKWIIFLHYLFIISFYKMYISLVIKQSLLFLLSLGMAFAGYTEPLIMQYI